jgi:hypothetical protein
MMLRLPTIALVFLAAACAGPSPKGDPGETPDAGVTSGTDDPTPGPTTSTPSTPASTPAPPVAGADAPASPGREAGTTVQDAGTTARVDGAASATVGDVAVNGSLSFFVTSVGAVDTGGNFGGLAGADAKCQKLATAVGAGARTWRAYLGVAVDGKNPMNAKDRIGKGPWFNAKGQMVAPDLATLHGTGTGIATAVIVDEHGARVPAREGGIITGSMHNGNVFPLRNCNGWTLNLAGSASKYAFARLGHANDSNPAHWNDSQGTDCSPTTWTQASQSTGRIYCFAAD